MMPCTRRLMHVSSHSALAQAQAQADPQHPALGDLRVARAGAAASTGGLCRCGAYGRNSAPFQSAAAAGRHQGAQARSALLDMHAPPSEQAPGNEDIMQAWCAHAMCERPACVPRGMQCAPALPRPLLTAGAAPRRLARVLAGQARRRRRERARARGALQAALAPFSFAGRDAAAARRRAAALAAAADAPAPPAPAFRAGPVPACVRRRVRRRRAQGPAVSMSLSGVARAAPFCDVGRRPSFRARRGLSCMPERSPARPQSRSWVTLLSPSFLSTQGAGLLPTCAQSTKRPGCCHAVKLSSDVGNNELLVMLG